MKDEHRRAYHHVSVLGEEARAALMLKAGDMAIDATLGGGGHTSMMLTCTAPGGKVIAIDQDAVAIAHGRERFSQEVANGALDIVHAKFGSIGEVAKTLSVAGKVSGILADIGVSSIHLDDSERGFSFMQDGPLDMRMDQSKGQLTAAELVNNWDEKDLADLFYKLGEEPKSRRIASAICKERASHPFSTTLHLASVVARAAGWAHPSKKHPATRVFQALRIAVNNELGELEQLLDQALDVLRPGGRLAVITFHSLEDRMVKTKFLDLTGQGKRNRPPRDLPLREVDVAKVISAKGRIVPPFPVVPSDEETSRNARARSAKLRVIEKGP